MAESEVVLDQAAYDAALAADLIVNTHLTTWEMLWRTAQRVPDNDALITGDTHISYRELASRSLRAAAALAEMGVGHGSRVAFVFHPSPDWAVLHYALARLGAVGVPINTSYMAAELEHLFTLAQPELLITVDRFRDVDMAARLSPLAARFDSIAETVVLPLDDDGWGGPVTAARPGVRFRWWRRVEPGQPGRRGRPGLHHLHVGLHRSTQTGADRP